MVDQRKSYLYSIATDDLHRLDISFAGRQLRLIRQRVRTGNRIVTRVAHFLRLRGLIRLNVFMARASHRFLKGYFSRLMKYHIRTWVTNDQVIHPGHRIVRRHHVYARREAGHFNGTSEQGQVEEQ